MDSLMLSNRVVFQTLVFHTQLRKCTEMLIAISFESFRFFKATYMYLSGGRIALYIAPCHNRWIAAIAQAPQPHGMKVGSVSCSQNIGLLVD